MLQTVKQKKWRQKKPYLFRVVKKKDMTKQKILVSFSAGETSAYMCHFLKENYSDKYKFIFVFANVGEENEETLIFADQCDKYFGLNLVWVEPKINKTSATKHTEVTFETAERSGLNGNFEKMIQRFGIPNMQNMICTRELKERPITSYARSIGWKKSDYITAIGIRGDEIDRISKNRIKNRFFYPLIELTHSTKPIINKFWDGMPFRLELKGYEGNCKWCWKKSDRKLATLAIERPEYFEFPKLMEAKYYNHVPSRDRNKLDLPIRFFRNNKTVSDLFELAKQPNFKRAKDDTKNITIQTVLDLEVECIGSCEPFQ